MCGVGCPIRLTLQTPGVCVVNWSPDFYAVGFQFGACYNRLGLGGFMPSREEILKTIREHWPRIVQFGVKRIGLFGSVARGDSKEGSDVDLLVELERPLGWEIVDLREYLQALLGVKVDLVTRPAVSKKALLWKSIQEDLIHV
jgi:predicted nucleotidyltransferase